MSVAIVSGWKDILRPIRDGYRHLFPKPDTGPTPQEREHQRQLDRLKGFSYFDTFDQLEGWTEAEPDPLQRANTPLLHRRAAPKYTEGRAKILICHDYGGNYQEYEHIQGAGVNEESYACEHLQFVDTFVYFSHKLACVPPPSWTNTLHRNGVKSLGTLLLEPQTKDTDRLLKHEKLSDGAQEGLSFPIAKKLATIAIYYGFDGWLVNIEKPFTPETWDPHILQRFLIQMKAELGPDRMLVWYDALTSSNKVAYQNALTQQNVMFAQACGNILTNYCWTAANLQSSKALARQSAVSQDVVFAGIDVWAQNPSSIAHPRVTYPEKGGGGTNTGIAVAKLADTGLSAGVFAPAWSFEHFPGHGPEVERAIWDGTTLSANVTCSCGNVDQRHPSNPGYPITHFAREFPAGSESFFYTDFSRAFARHFDGDWRKDGVKLRSQLASQSILPHIDRKTVIDDRVESSANILSQRLENLPGLTQLVIEAHSATPSDDGQVLHERWLPLFRLDMPADGSLQLRFLVRCAASGSRQQGDYVTMLYLKCSNGIRSIPLEESVDFTRHEVSITSDSRPFERLEEIGVYLRAPSLPVAPIQIAEIREILIQPTPASESTAGCSIDGLHIESRGTGDTQHWRLCWNYGEQRNGSSLIPHSELTGPFSYFIVSMNSVSLGKAYCLEYVIPSSLVDSFMSKHGAQVTITGKGFNGRQLAERTVKLSIM